MTNPLNDRGIVTCRGCGAQPLVSVFDLGEQPVSNRLLARPADADPRFPLHLMACTECGLGQIGEYLLPDQIFDDEYPYLSSMSSFWLEHAERYAAQLTEEMRLGPADLVVEAASNDGYLLARFVERGIRVLGVEPSGNVADLAIAKGVPTLKEFFGVESAHRIVAEYGHPRLVAANNVAAHVPDLEDFLGGFAALADDSTVITVENPSFAEMLRLGQFDTIYHEHFSYLSAIAVDAAARRSGLLLWRVERLPTHGGSNRYWLALPEAREVEDSVASFMAEEARLGVRDPAAWADFARRSEDSISSLRRWLLERDAAGRRVIGYGAAAKGNTFLNAIGPEATLLRSVIDASPEKQGRFLPGTHLPVKSPDQIAAEEPDDVLILPWNLAAEISQIVRTKTPNAESWIAIPSMTRVS